MNSMTVKENKTENRSLGSLGERIAANYLKNKDYSILAMNYFNPKGKRLGEIDIIAKDPKNGEIVFVEVKSRDYLRFKDAIPEENITHAKLVKLERIAQLYMRNKSLSDSDYRFDAISIWIDSASRRAKIKHLERL